jgi:hypothetical protein
MNSKDIDFQDVRKPVSVWVNWELDDQGLSLIAYRAYGHILRRAGGKGHAWPSYQSIGDTCFSADSNSPRTRRDWAIKAIKELCDRQLLRKAFRVSSDQKNLQSNIYQITDKDDWILPSRSTTTTPSRSTTTTPSRSTTTVSNSILSNSNIEVVQGQGQEIHTATNQSSEQNQFVSTKDSPSSFSENSQQPEGKIESSEGKNLKPSPLLVDPDPETVHSATPQQASDPCAEPTKRQESAPPRSNPRKLVYGDRCGDVRLTRFVMMGEKNGWWRNDQVDLAAFQWAIHDFRLGQGYDRPGGAVKAMFEGLEKGDQSAIEEIAGYWARYDRETQIIAAKAAEPMPWVKDGQVIPAYASWVKNPHNGFDVIYADGTSQLDLILTTTKSNKIADRTWQQYQDYVAKEDRRRQQIDADMAKFQAERDAEAAKTPEQRAAEKAEIQKIMAEWRAGNADKAA